uniref:hypothetical protein n=1 Tax=Alistipes finegoldii TaxID=214856 RepID=UPI0025A40AB9
RGFESLHRLGQPMREKRKDEGLPEHEQRRNESLTGKTRAKSEPIFQGQTTWEVTRVAKWGRL